jgi:hypothetical protein
MRAEQVRWLVRLTASPRGRCCAGPWGITEHHDATDNVYALSNLSLLAVGAKAGYVYIRGEYALAAHRLQHAIELPGTAGELTDFSVEVRRGGGA